MKDDQSDSTPPDSSPPDSSPPDSTPPDSALDSPETSVILRNLGAIKAAAIIMGVLIIILLALVIGTIASRLSSMSAPPEAASISLPAGAELQSAAADGDGLILLVKTPQGQEIWRVTNEGVRRSTLKISSP